MRYLFTFLFLLFIICPGKLFPQDASVRNLGYSIHHKRLVIDYDLISEVNESQSVLFFLWDNSYNVLIPRTVFGDVGESVVPGRSRQITWDIVQDNELLTGRLRPRVILKNEFYQRGGSGSAFYSLLVPGLGGYFVADRQNMVFKPYLRTISSVSFIGLGIKALQMRTREPLYSEHVNPRTGTTETRFYGYGPHSHWLFPNDHVVFLGLGAAVWIYDIIWVANRGGRNDKLRRALSNIELNRNYLNGYEIGFRHQF